MIHWLCAAVLVLAQDASPSYFQVPLEELELAPAADARRARGLEPGWGRILGCSRACCSTPGAAVYVSSSEFAEHWARRDHRLRVALLRSDRPGP
jgi:hypothetical protein